MTARQPRRWESVALVTRWAPWLPVTLAAGAIWPVWSYLARSWTAPGADAGGGFVLLATLAWAVWLGVREQKPVSRALSPWVVLLLVAYSAGYGTLPALARALLGLGAFGLALVGMPGLGWRERSGLAALVVLAAPSPDTLNFLLGGPLRAAATGFAAVWLSAMGLDA